MLVRMTELDHMSSVKMATIEIELHTAVTMEMADSLQQLLGDGLINKVSSDYNSEGEILHLVILLNIVGWHI